MTLERTEAMHELIDAVGETLDKDFGFWSSPTQSERRTRLYRAWKNAAALRSSTPQEPLTDEQIERVAFFVEHGPTHPPGGAREMVSRKLVRQIIEAYRLQAKAPETGWQPIETAPKDGTRILAYQDGDVFAVEWDMDFPDDSYWKSFCGQYVTETPEPTHWQPLPEPPGTDYSGIVP